MFSRSLRQAGRWLRSAVRQALATVWYYTGLFWLWSRLRRRWGPPALLVPMYHRLRTTRHAAAELLDIERGVWLDRFRRHLHVFRRYGGSVTLSEAAAWLDRDEARGVRVAVTFDDGYRDTAAGLELMLRSGQRATVFPVVSAAEGEELLWWDRLALSWRAGPSAEGEKRQSLSQLVEELVTLPEHRRRWLVRRLVSTNVPQHAPSELYFGCAELAEWQRRGFELGGHSVTHAALPAESPSRVRAELFGSREFLRNSTGQAPYSFAYPHGLHDAATRAAVQEAGFRCAVTTEPGANSRLADRWQWKRVPVGDEPAAVVALQLTWYDMRDVLLPALGRAIFGRRKACERNTRQGKPPFGAVSTDRTDRTNQVEWSDRSNPRSSTTGEPVLAGGPCRQGPGHAVGTGHRQR